MKLRWWFISLSLLPLACNLGPLLLEATPTATPTATATATPIPTLAPTSTETPAVVPTFYLIPTQVPAPATIACPKGTELRMPENKCFYATRTPDPRKIICAEYVHKSACINHGCSWNATSGKCS